MLANKVVRLTVIGAGILLALVVLFYPTDEKRVKAAAEAIVTAANTGELELERALDEHASPDVSLEVPELPEPVRGPAAIAALVGQASRLGQKPSLRIEAVEVTVEGNRARLNADLLTTLRPELPELRRPRHAVALFEKRAGRFRLLSAEIGSERRDQPEARP
jgi:SnoaL-like domain